jgi:hypothetical protein
VAKVSAAKKREPRLRTAVVAGSAVGVALALIVGVVMDHSRTSPREARTVWRETTTSPSARYPDRPDDWMSRSYPLATDWRRVPMESVDNAFAAARHVEIDDGRLVAFGSGPSSCCDFDRVSWESSDAETWKDRPYPSELDEGLFGAGALDFASAHGLRVAVGFALVQPIPEHLKPDPSFAAAWFSTDGKQWERAVGDERVFGRGERIERVWATKDGFVALGWHGGLDIGNRSPAAWSSEDGRTWVRLDGIDAPGVDGGNAVQLPSGEIVAVAGDPATVWRSSDGRNWTRLAGFARNAPHPGPKLVLLENRIAALGSVSGGQELWLSGDRGSTWERIGMPFGPKSEAYAIRATPVGYVAIGNVALDPVKWRPTLWVSQDGRSWKGVPDLEGIFAEADLGDLIAFQDRLIIVGGVEAPSGNKPRYRAMTWVHALCQQPWGDDPTDAWPSCPESR